MKGPIFAQFRSHFRPGRTSISYPSGPRALSSGCEIDPRMIPPSKCELSLFSILESVLWMGPDCVRCSQAMGNGLWGLCQLGFSQYIYKGSTNLCEGGNNHLHWLFQLERALKSKHNLISEFRMVKLVPWEGGIRLSLSHNRRVTKPKHNLISFVRVRGLSHCRRFNKTKRETILWKLHIWICIVFIPILM